MSINITVPWMMRLINSSANSPRSKWSSKQYEEISKCPVLAAQAVLEKEDLDNLGILYHRAGRTDD